ncbi:MAG: DUF1801 domain-containing protein [Spirochaetota bacterium]
MNKQKTRQTEDSVINFIETVPDERKRTDSYTLLELFTETTGYEARMWGSSIIGFGSYHYRYNSGHEGDAPLVGFSPRKKAISVYTAVGLEDIDTLREGLGKHRMGKACLYVNKLADIDLDVLRDIIRASVDFLQKTYG